MKANKLILLALLAASAASQAEGLGQLYQEALSSDSQYAAAQAQYVAVQERVPQALAGLLPSLNFSANTTINHNNSTNAGFFSHDVYNSNGYTLNGTLPIYRPQYRVALDQSRVALEQARAQVELARQDLIIRLSQAYFDVLFAQDSLASIQAQRAAIAEQLTSVKRKFDIGTAAITDVSDTQARYDLVLAQEIAAQNDIQAKRYALRLVINKDAGTLASLRAGIELSSPTPDNMQTWVQSAETSGLAVLSGQYAVDIARLESDKARAADYPNLDLVGTDGHSKSATTTTVGTDLRNKTLGFQLTIPIVSGGASLAHRREMVALLTKAQAELDGARRTGALTARQAFLGVTSGLAQIKALSQALLSARTALNANKRGLEVGVRVDVDLLNAQQQYAMTERDLAKSRYDTLMALLRLKGAAGSLGEDDVAGIDALLANAMN